MSLVYSIPFRDTLSLVELKKHLFSLPDHPDWLPYRTSYYKRTWGFCLPYRQLTSLPEGEYEVCVDSTLAPGSLTYGELLLPGLCADEVLISCHVCHPSLANDNLSGIAVATFLASQLAQRNRRYSYRFIFIPGTIGSITWLALNEHNVKNIRHGLILAGVGDKGAFHYKKTRNGDAYIDRLMLRVLRQTGRAHRRAGFRTVRLRRAAIRVAWLQSSSRLPNAHAVRSVSRIPFLCRRSSLCETRKSGRHARFAGTAGGNLGRRNPLSQSQPARRAATWAPRTVRRLRAASVRRSNVKWPCSGC